MKEKISSQNIYLTENQRAFVARLAAQHSPQISVQQMARHLLDQAIKQIAMQQEQKA
ncbi:MAG: hypothetical protein E6X99_23055 [Pantoea sp.]|nr:hypothetical protein [Pantoea sp.]